MKTINADLDGFVDLGGWAHFLGEEVPAQTAELQQMHGKRGSI
jgi:hypothetical protein